MLPSNSEETPARVFYDAATRFLDVQISTNHELDSKGGNIFSVGSAVLPVTFGLLSLSPNSVPRWAIVALVLALIAYGCLLICGWRASTFRGLEYRPDLQTLDEYRHEYDGDTLLQWVATEYMESTKVNEWQLERKARWTGAANTALYAEGVFLSVAAILTLF